MIPSSANSVSVKSSPFQMPRSRAYPCAYTSMKPIASTAKSFSTFVIGSVTYMPPKAYITTPRPGNVRMTAATATRASMDIT